MNNDVKTVMEKPLATSFKEAWNAIMIEKKKQKSTFFLFLHIVFTS